MLKKLISLATTVSVGLPLMVASAMAEEKIDLDVMNKIRNEGFYNSQVMKHVAYLSDNIGQRLSSSPQVMQANNWAMDQFNEWGMENVHLEGFEFGRGWTFENISVQMTAPRHAYIQAVPKAWFPGTDGEVEGEVVRMNIKTEADFEKHRGKLKGKIIAIRDKVKINKSLDKYTYHRHDEESLEESKSFPIPRNKRKAAKPGATKAKLEKDLKRQKFLKKAYQFYKDEGALAIITASGRRYSGLFNGTSNEYLKGYTPAIPQIELAGESYNRMLRLMKQGETVKLKINVEATYHDEDTKNYNVLADIPGKGSKRKEIVLAGAHIDSWHLGDGAADNGAGVAIVMEAMRILKAIGVKPKRTIRAGLWGAEEQGLNGSRFYIQKHLAEYPKFELEGSEGYPEWRMREKSEPIKLKSGYNKLSVYFNLDNGSGKIRGIKTHGNVATQAIFDQWFAPFEDLGANTASSRSSGGTDHAAFQSVGIPGYQFIQDALDYFPRIHHTQLDVLDYVSEKDLKQASVVMAAFIYNAAMRDEMMPRRPAPMKIAD